MTVIEQLITAALDHPHWNSLIERTQPVNDPATCQDWGRKGGSHYKDGQFDKK